MKVLITKVDAVRDHGDTLTIVTVGEHEVVANKRIDGTARWVVGQPVVYVPEGALVPEDVLKERGYWDHEKNKGLLEGKRGNRVKMRRFAGFESRGLLFYVESLGNDWTGENTNPDVIGWILRENKPEDGNPDNIYVKMGDDVTEFLGITEHKA